MLLFLFANRLQEDWPDGSKCISLFVFVPIEKDSESVRGRDLDRTEISFLVARSEFRKPQIRKHCDDCKGSVVKMQCAQMGKMFLNLETRGLQVGS